MNARLRAVVAKEFAEYRHNRLVVLTMALLPAFLFAMGLAALILLPAGAPPQDVRAAGGSALELFILIPVIMPTVVSVYSVLGEREQGTLEPVLTTPVRDGELLGGKVVAACVPSIALAWLLFGVFAVAASIWAEGAIVRQVLTAESVFVVLLLAPFVALFAVIMTMLVSARSRDLRVAQQLSGLSILPIVAVAIVVGYQIVPPGYLSYALIAVGIGAIDLLGWRLLVRVFDRERLLTRFAATTT